jgi:5-methylcytosine-specific restriction endonuclease McrA
MRVYERDHGVCAECGTDTHELKKLIEKMVANDDKKNEVRHGFGAGNRVNRVLVALGFKSCQSLWEADHIIPVILGGGNTLDNLRTLCVPCHKKDTAELAAARSKKNIRAEKQAEIKYPIDQLSIDY